MEGIQPVSLSIGRCTSGESNDWFIGRWACLSSGMLYGVCSHWPGAPFISEVVSASGNQHRFTATSASSLATWGTSAAVAFICCSLQVAHWDHVNWASTFPSPFNRWMSDLLSTVNLDCLVTFVRTPSKKPAVVLAPRSARLRKARRPSSL